MSLRWDVRECSKHGFDRNPDPYGNDAIIIHELKYRTMVIARIGMKNIMVMGMFIEHSEPTVEMAKKIAETKAAELCNELIQELKAKEQSK